MTNEIYQRVTSKIVADMEKGELIWLKPWRGGGRAPLPLRVTGEPYRGINVFMLWATGLEKGYDSATWMTLKQANKLKGQVKKGEKAALVVYADKMEKYVTDRETGEEKPVEIHYLKPYWVFNADQITGLPEKHYYLPERLFNSTAARDANAEEFIKNTGASIEYAGNRAFYNRKNDFIRVPHLEDFENTEGFYNTLTHEVVHWSGHESRLNREFGKMFGDNKYAREELIAELGSAFLCAMLEITKEPRNDHAAYIQHWMKGLKQDPKVFFTAASEGQKACDYLWSLQPVRPAIAPSVKPVELAA